MDWSTFLSVIIGGFISSVTPIIVAVMSSRHEHRRNLLRCATDAAIKDFEVSCILAKKSGGRIFPMSTYVYYHVKFLELADQRKLDGSSISELLLQRDKILELYEKVPAESYKFMQSVLKQRIFYE